MGNRGMLAGTGGQVDEIRYDDKDNKRQKTKKDERQKTNDRGGDPRP